MPSIFADYVLILVRILITTMGVIYAIFAVLMSRQIGQMTKAVTMKDSGVITLLGYIHLFFAAVVLLLSVTML